MAVILDRQTSAEDERQKVVAALSDKKWDFRTVRGISKSTGLPEERVLEVLRNHPEVVKSSVPDEKGDDLFTLRERFSKAKDIFNAVRTFVSGSLD